VIEEIKGTGRAIDSGKHAGIGSSINDPINGRNLLKVGRVSNVPFDKLHAENTKGSLIQPTSCAREVIKSPDLNLGLPNLQLTGNLRSDESANPCDEDLHQPMQEA